MCRATRGGDLRGLMGLDNGEFGVFSALGTSCAGCCETGSWSTTECVHSGDCHSQANSSSKSFFPSLQEGSRCRIVLQDRVRITQRCQVQGPRQGAYVITVGCCKDHPGHPAVTGSGSMCCRLTWSLVPGGPDTECFWGTSWPKSTDGLSLQKNKYHIQPFRAQAGGSGFTPDL